MPAGGARLLSDVDGPPDQEGEAPRQPQRQVGVTTRLDLGQRLRTGGDSGHVLTRKCVQTGKEGACAGVRVHVLMHERATREGRAIRSGTHRPICALLWQARAHCNHACLLPAHVGHGYVRSLASRALASAGCFRTSPSPPPLLALSSPTYASMPRLRNSKGLWRGASAGVRELGQGVRMYDRTQTCETPTHDRHMPRLTSGKM